MYNCRPTLVGDTALKEIELPLQFIFHKSSHYKLDLISICIQWLALSGNNLPTLYNCFLTSHLGTSVTDLKAKYSICPDVTEHNSRLSVADNASYLFL